MTHPLFDTHCHLYNSRYDQDREQVLTECDQKLKGWIHIGADLQTSRECRDLAMLYPEKSWFTAGIHPHDVSTAATDDLEEIENLLLEDRCVAAGEMGLDYFYKHTPREQQIESFRLQLQMAKRLKKPVVIHVRDAFDDFYSLVDEVGWFSGVVHCFTGNLAQGKAIVERGFMVSFGGMLTFSNTQEIQEAASSLPLTSILLETDSPYLSPIPFRGRRNHPIYVEYAGLRLAELRKEEPEVVFATTYQNACRLFGLEGGCAPSL